MSEPTNPDAVPKAGNRLGATATVLLLSALLVGGGALLATWLLGALIGLGDACSYGPTTIKCKSRETPVALSWLLLVLPPAGLLGGLSLGTVRATIDIRRGQTGLRAAGIAWAIFVGAFILTIPLAQYILD